MDKTNNGMNLRSKKIIKENLVPTIRKTRKTIKKNVLSENNSDMDIKIDKNNNTMQKQHSNKTIYCGQNKFLTHNEESFLVDVTIIKNVLGSHYYNIRDRLKIDYVPHCIDNYVDCYQKHLSDKVGPAVTYEYRKHHMLYEDFKFGLFLVCIEHMISENIFPDDSLLMIINSILNIDTNTEVSKKMNTFYLSELVLIFEKILDKFPLCWANLNQQYYTIIFKKNINVKPFTDNYSDEYGIFGVILAVLDELLTNNDLNNNNFKCDELNDSEFINSSMGEIDFIDWSDVHKFSKFSRDEQLNRIFMTLHLLIKIFEHDLAIWLFYYEKYLPGELKMPLITLFINKYINNYPNLLRMYGKCISLKLSKDKINIFSRLINLLANNALINEMRISNTLIKYPHINFFGEDFARDLMKIMDSYNGDNNLIMSFISNVSTPYVKMLLYDKFLDRLRNNMDYEKLSLQKIYNVFANKEWLHFKNFYKNIKLQDPDNHISRFNFIYMYKELFVIYCNIFQVNNVIKEFIKKDIDSSNYKMNLDNQLVCCHLDIDYRKIIQYKNDIIYYYKLKNLMYNNHLQYYKLFDEFSRTLCDLI